MLVFKKYNDSFFEAKLEVEEAQNGLRLDQIVGEYLSGHSREQIKKKIKAGEAKVINRDCSNKSSAKLKTKDIIEIIIHRTSHEDEYWRGELLPLEKPKVIYEDDDLLVINKPPFMSTHPTGKHLFNCATVYYENKLDLKTVHSVHRLDRETSGVLILTKNPKAANAYTEEFEKNSVRKCYLWISKRENFSATSDFSADQNLGNPYSGLKRVIVEAFSNDSELGKKAFTDFQILESNEKYSIGLAFPLTGRTHQIRVHAREFGHPLIGDKLYLGGYPLFQRFKDNLYNSKDCDDVISPRHFLHAFSLKIKNNIFHAPLNDDMKEFYIKHFDGSIESLFEAAKQKVEIYFNKDFK
jgi:RluA family pseudouridine synthase